MIIESDGKGADLVGSILQVDSGGLLEVDNIRINVSYLVVNDAAMIRAKVSMFMSLSFLKYL